MTHYKLPLGREREKFDLEGFINKIRLSQDLLGCEHHFFVDDVIGNYDEALSMDRMDTYNTFVLVESSKKKNVPSYLKEFNETQNPLERIEQLIAHIDEVVKDVPPISFQEPIVYLGV